MMDQEKDVQEQQQLRKRSGIGTGALYQEQNLDPIATDFAIDQPRRQPEEEEEVDRRRELMERIERQHAEEAQKVVARQRRRVRWWALGLGLGLALALVVAAAVAEEGWWWSWGWGSEWWWVWVAAAVVLVIAAAAGVAAVAAFAGVAVGVTLGKRLLSWWLYVVTAHVLAPILRGLRHVPGLERTLNNVLRATFLVWFYGMIPLACVRALSAMALQRY
jgi:FtsH-binding integral membrane protein